MISIKLMKKKEGALREEMEKRLNGNGFLFFVKLLIRGVCRVIEIRLVKTWRTNGSNIS